MLTGLVSQNFPYSCPPGLLLITRVYTTVIKTSDQLPGISPVVVIETAINLKSGSMDKLNTVSNPLLLNSSISSVSGSLTSGTPCANIQLTEKQIPGISTGHVSGYVTRRVPEKTIADRVYLHPLTRTDYKQQTNKECLFERLIPSLMSKTGMSQTTVLTHLLPVLEFTPYLRKINREVMEKVSDHPPQLQTGLLLELITRLKQGYKLQELHRLAGEQSTAAEIKINGQAQTLSISLHHFTREDLGDETFRELRDRLIPSGKRDGKDPGVILDHVRKRKTVSMAHWQKILLMVLKDQNSATRQHIANALNSEHSLSPVTEAECKALTALIPTLELTVHPGFSLLKPLFTWLSKHHLKGDKLSSRQLTWLQSMVTHRLYTKLPDLTQTGIEELCIYKEPLVSGHETDNTRGPSTKEEVNKAINDATPQQLTEVVELFAPLLCDLTPSVSAENRLGIIYTLLKFRDQSLLINLLATESIGDDVLMAMYKTQLILTYSIDENATEAVKKSREQSVNCLLKTLQLRMAQCIIMMASTGGLSVSSETLTKARTLIDHHNEGLQAEAHKPDRHDSDDNDDDSDWETISYGGYSNSGFNRMPYGSNTISAENYLNVPDHLLTSGRVVTLDPQRLMLPRDKHFRIHSAKLKSHARNQNRRIKRKQCDDQKLRKDFLLSPQSTDLTRPVDWLKMEVPITFLFTGNTQDKSQTSCAFRVFNTELLPFIQQATRESTGKVSANRRNAHQSRKRPLSETTDYVPRKVLKTEASTNAISATANSAKCPLEERETMSVIRELLALAETTGKPGLDLRAIITRIKKRTSNQTLRSLLQHMVTVLPGLPANHIRRELLELTAFQLFAELHPADNQFKRLIKTLYIIQSRSQLLQFADDGFGKFGNSKTNKLKLQLGKLFRNEWSQPDGLLRNRIRQSVKAAVRQSDSSCSYQQIMNTVLESIRPSNQSPDGYPRLISRMSRKVEKRMNQRWELTSLEQRQKILKAHRKPVGEELLSYQIKKLIKTASGLCEQFLPEESVSSTKPMSYDAAPVDADTPMSDQINATETIHNSTLLTRGYLYNQLKALIPLIGTWLNQISDDRLITEKAAAKAGIDKLVQFANSTVRANHTIEDEDETLNEIITLCDQFHHLQQEHSQWQSNREIVSTHKQWVEAKNTLKKLNYIDQLPSPQELQEQINRVMSDPEIPVLSPQEQELLRTVSALRTRYTETKIVNKALFYPEIRKFNDQPEQLAHRIAEVSQPWSDRTLAQHEQYRSLQCTLNHLQMAPLYNVPEAEKRKALKKARESHDRRIDCLQSMQEKCQLHPAQQLRYRHDPPLLSTLDSMAQGHTAEYSGIATKPLSEHLSEHLSEQQRQQLQAVMESAPLEPALSIGTSLFDLIGMENSQQRKAAASNRSSRDSPGTTRHKVYKTLRKLKRKNTRKIEKQQKKIERENTTLDEMERAHYKRIRKLQECKEAMFHRLDNRMHCEIVIGKTAYSYAAALIAFNYKDNYTNLKDMGSIQHAASCLSQAHFYYTRNEERYRQDMQWLGFARQCRSQNINPEILPKVLHLIELESRVPIDDIENKMHGLQQQIQATENTIAENEAQVKAAVAQLETSLKPELEAQTKTTQAAELALFTKAFEHGQHLSEDRMIQHLLCQYLREDRDATSVRARIIEDCKALQKHVPANYTDIIEPTSPETNKSNDRWLSTHNLPFQIINVPGAFPLLEFLHKEGRMSSWQFLRLNDEGKPCSALVFAAAKGCDRSCEKLINCLEKTRYLHLASLNQMLTANPSGDNRNLLHLIAQLAKPALLKSLLQLLNTVSKQQDFDADYSPECLQNRIALDRQHLLKTLLAQTDYEGLHPTDLLLFNVAKRIRKWPEDNNRALKSYCNDFLINEAKRLWITVSESLSVEQSCQSVECFMKGIDSLEGLSPAKRKAAEAFLRKLMRIFRVHGPAGVYKQLMAQITRVDHSIDTTEVTNCK